MYQVCFVNFQKNWHSHTQVSDKLWEIDPFFVCIETDNNDSESTFIQNRMVAYFFYICCYNCKESIYFLF